MAGTMNLRGLQRGLALASLLPVLVLAAACGAKDDAGAAPSAPTEAVTTVATADQAAGPGAAMPECSTVWVVGERLPETYAGCQDAGVPAEDTTVPCAIGDVVIEHGDGFYATPGRPIRLAEAGYAADPAYQRMHTICTG